MDTDLDILLPEQDSVTFTARDGVKYKIDIYIPFAVGAFILENTEALIEVFPGGGRMPKISLKTYNLFLKIFALVCKEDHEHMDEEWIRHNISLPRAIAIIVQLVMPVYRYISQLGILEAVQPVKEPADSD